MGTARPTFPIQFISWGTFLQEVHLRFPLNPYAIEPAWQLRFTKSEKPLSYWSLNCALSRRSEPRWNGSFLARLKTSVFTFFSCFKLRIFILKRYLCTQGTCKQRRIPFTLLQKEKRYFLSPSSPTENEKIVKEESTWKEEDWTPLKERGRFLPRLF